MQPKAPIVRFETNEVHRLSQSERSSLRMTCPYSDGISTRRAAPDQMPEHGRETWGTARSQCDRERTPGYRRIRCGDGVGPVRPRCADDDLARALLAGLAHLSTPTACSGSGKTRPVATAFSGDQAGTPGVTRTAPHAPALVAACSAGAGSPRRRSVRSPNRGRLTSTVQQPSPRRVMSKGPIRRPSNVTRST